MTTLRSTLIGDASPMERRSTRLFWILWVIWVPLMIPAILNYLRQHPTPPQAFVSLSGVTLFFAVYLMASFHAARQIVTLEPAALTESPLRTWAPLAFLLLVAWALAASDAQVWGQLFIYVAAYAGGRIPTRQAIWGVAVVFVVTALGIWRSEPSWSNFFGGAVFVAIVGGACIVVAQSRLTTRDLRMAREEVARLAVTAERLRFARDLHDLLGHSLSLITLKTELARQLVEVNPARAAAELDDIERAARESLREIREAVSGYRQATLASELHEAEKMLAAAGISYRCHSDSRLLGSLAPMAEAVLSWTVREGVTNVIRHSRARACHIRLLRAGTDACVEIGDDGGSRLSATWKGAEAAAPGDGNGLRGLAERVAALGGRFEAGPAAGGGYRLAVSVPSQSMQPHASATAGAEVSERGLRVLAGGGEPIHEGNSRGEVDVDSESGAGRELA